MGIDLRIILIIAAVQINQTSLFLIILKTMIVVSLSRKDKGLNVNLFQKVSNNLFHSTEVINNKYWKPIIHIFHEILCLSWKVNQESIIKIYCILINSFFYSFISIFILRCVLLIDLQIIRYTRTIAHFIKPYRDPVHF